MSERRADDERRHALERRATVSLAGRGGDEATVRAHWHDPDAGVRGAALVALVRAGWATPADGAAAVADPDARVRTLAGELAPALPGADYRRLLADEDAGVVEAAAFACGETMDEAAVEALRALALDHEDPLCREAAVAALGAIGAEAGVDAVLAALTDVPAVRRRAVVALAAFSGPAVDAALEERLGDRDWQVRQAAEDVLGVEPALRGRAREPAAPPRPPDTPPRR